MSKQVISIDELNRIYNQSIENIKLMCQDKNGAVDVSRVKQSLVNLWFFHFLPQHDELDRVSINKIRHLFDEKVYELDKDSSKQAFSVELTTDYKPYKRKASYA